nr:hypothetical protein [Tanacetum cinerariifolium]
LGCGKFGRIVEGRQGEAVFRLRLAGHRVCGSLGAQRRIALGGAGGGGFGGLRGAATTQGQGGGQGQGAAERNESRFHKVTIGLLLAGWRGRLARKRSRPVDSLPVGGVHEVKIQHNLLRIGPGISVFGAAVEEVRSFQIHLLGGSVHGAAHRDGAQVIRPHMLEALVVRARQERQDNVLARLHRLRKLGFVLRDVGLVVDDE